MIIPSHSLPPGEFGHIKGYHLYERLLFLLLLLRRPGVRVVYVSSHPIHPAIIDYYLSFLPDSAEARRRLHMISIERSSNTDWSLSGKILDSPAVLRKIIDERRARRVAASFRGNPRRREARRRDRPEDVWSVSKPRISVRQQDRMPGSEQLAGVDTVPGVGGLTDINDIEDAAWRLAAEHGMMLD